MPTFVFMATEPTSTVYPVKYWDGYILDEERLFSALTSKEKRAALNTLSQFRMNNYVGAGYKAFVGASVHTLRVNIQDRLVFSTHLLDGYRCAIIHGYMHHNYKTYLYTNSSNAAQLYNEKHHETMMHALLASTERSKTSTEPTPLAISTETFYNKKIVELTAEQRNCVFDPAHINKSGVITGAAGTGKTLVMLTTIKAALVDNPKLQIRCITPCRLLTKNLINQWNDEGYNAANVVFMTYEQFIVPFTSHLRQVDDDHLDDWYRKVYLDKLRKQRMISSHKEDIVLKADSANLVRQTFKFFAGRSVDQIAARDIVFTDAGAKHILIEAYNAWINYLNDHQLFHPAFYVIAEHSHVAQVESLLVVIDESQDFTMQQVKNIYYDAKHAAPQSVVLFNYDSHQISDMYCSSRELILKMIEHDTHEIPRHSLLEVGNQRSHADIVAFADTVVGIKYKATCGKVDIDECASLNRAVTATASLANEALLEGVVWLDKSNNRLAQVARLFNFHAVEHVILTHEHLIEEAITLFRIRHADGTIAFEPLVLSFQQAKGLEYDRVLLYKPFEHPAFVSVDKLFKKDSSQIHPRPNHKAKKNEGDRKYMSVFNDVISGALRAKLFMAIFQDKDYLRGVMGLFANMRVALNSESFDLSTAYCSGNSTSVAWAKQIEDMILIGNNKNLKQKYEEHHCQEVTHQTFEVFERSVLNMVPTVFAASVNTVNLESDSLEKQTKSRQGWIKQIAEDIRTGKKTKKLKQYYNHHRCHLDTHQNFEQFEQSIFNPSINIPATIQLVEEKDTDSLTIISPKIITAPFNKIGNDSLQNQIKKALLTITKHNFKSAKKTEDAFAFLLTIAQNEENHAIIKQEKGIDIFISWLTSDDLMLVDYAVSALTHLAVNKANHRIMLDSACIDPLMASMAITDIVIQRQVYNILRILFFDNYEEILKSSKFSVWADIIRADYPPVFKYLLGLLSPAKMPSIQAMEQSEMKQNQSRSFYGSFFNSVLPDSTSVEKIEHDDLGSFCAIS